MLQSVLSPIPSYAMTTFKLLVSLCKRIQSKVTRFWWDDSTGKKKIAWTSWEKMSNQRILEAWDSEIFKPSMMLSWEN